ncbi:MAG TPA: hypothetical protein VD978_19590 [Azospirillum sp.]|nr:hypothetical protein [Azospirillum sp.]
MGNAVNVSIGHDVLEEDAFGDAVSMNKRALALCPANPRFLVLAGQAAARANDRAAAIVWRDRAHAVQPGNPDVHYLMAILHLQAFNGPEGIRSAHLAVRGDPTRAEFHYMFGIAMSLSRAPEIAVAAYRRAIALRPTYVDAVMGILHQRKALCDWHDAAFLERLVERFADGNAGFSPGLMLAVGACGVRQLNVASRFSARYKAPPLPARPLPPPVSRVLRIGYLSSDFRQHATAHLIAGLFEAHDRAAVHVSAYSLVDAPRDEARLRIEQGVDSFVDVSRLSDEAAAHRIAADRLDILVDLNGLTSGCRPGILARRPAPHQVTYLGYPGTTGSPWIDYLIADDTVIPPHLEDRFSERILRMRCYQVNDRRRPRPDKAPAREELGLPNDAVVFASFNGSYKITPNMFGCWMRILHAVPGSVLWVLAPAPAMETLRRYASRCGIDPKRLVGASREPIPRHIARHRCADLMLDTFPCNGHTTTSDALWAGLPVLTLSGETFASRVAASLLKAVGLPMMVTDTMDAYMRRAVELGRSPETLKVMASHLDAKRDAFPLFDTDAQAREIETLFRTIAGGGATAGAGPDSIPSAR